jgi:hypothetical protein
MNAINDYQPFNFMLNYKDVSELNIMNNSRNTSLIFANRSKKNKNVNQGTLSEILKIYSGLKACEYMLSKK